MGRLAFSGWARGDVLTTALDLRVWVNGLVHATAGARQAYTHPTPVLIHLKNTSTKEGSYISKEDDVSC